MRRRALWATWRLWQVVKVGKVVKVVKVGRAEVTWIVIQCRAGWRA